MSELLDVKFLRPNKSGIDGIGYRINLPMEWIRKHGLEKGGRLLIKENDEGNLILEKQS